MPFVHITTRISGRKDEDLLMEKGGTATPYVALMDAEGNVLGQPPWPFAPALLRDSVQKVRRWQELRAKGEAGDATAAVDAQLLACELGQVAFDDLEIDAEALSESQRALYAQRGVDSEVAFLSVGMRSAGRDEQKTRVVVRDLVAIRDAGHRPSTPELKHFFWQVLSRKAIEDGDVAALEAAVNDVKATPGLEEMSKGLEAKLAGLRATNEKGNKDK